MKEVKGNSEGFTGLSELIVFRYLLHHLGGSFEKKKISPQQFGFFTENFQVKCNYLISVDDKRYKPDILVFQSGDLVAFVSIKTYLPNGKRTVLDEIEVMRKFKIIYPKMKSLLIIFDSQPQKIRKNGVLEKLEETSKNKSWFSFLYLKNNSALFGKTIDQYLGF